MQHKVPPKSWHVWMARYASHWPRDVVINQSSAFRGDTLPVGPFQANTQALTVVWGKLILTAHSSTFPLAIKQPLIEAPQGKIWPIEQQTQDSGNMPRLRHKKTAELGEILNKTILTGKLGKA
jgi:hypothetical protein